MFARKKIEFIPAFCIFVMVSNPKKSSRLISVGIGSLQKPDSSHVTFVSVTTSDIFAFVTIVFVVVVSDTRGTVKNKSLSDSLESAEMKSPLPEYSISLSIKSKISSEVNIKGWWAKNGSNGKCVGYIILTHSHHSTFNDYGIVSLDEIKGEM